jgi:uncharacterized protein DUF6600
MHARALVFAVAAAASLLGCLVYDPGPATHPVPYPSPAPAPVPAPSVEIRFFYDALDPDGDWLWMPPYGWVWAPAAVDPFWRPYTAGHWIWTDWGWTWVSPERWGWATYHYGRWVRAPRHGWVWIPGDVWGPGWVAWRRGPGLVGWAPLPPDVRFHAGVGLDWGGIDVDVAIDVGAWCFLDEARFADDDVGRYAYPVGRNATAVRTTKHVTNVRLNGSKIINEGIDRGEIERAIHRPIKERRVVDQPRPALRPATVIGDDVEVYRPAVQEHDHADPPHAQKEAAPQAPEEVFQGGAAEKNWDRRWNDDWRKLQKVQERDVPPKAAGTPPAPAVEKQHREENREAADNAYRELVVEHAREKRKAERTPGQASKPPKKDDKKEGNKPEGNP